MANSASGPSKGCEGEGFGKNKAKVTPKSVRKENNDERKRINSHAELAHEIGYALRNKCLTAKWASWKKVSKDLKKSMLEDLAVSGS
ncbi:acyl carrier protein 1 [Pyrus ussuriensis x Pyrus communis]|uniref:Acyl carrier protein 1 n=1 Tax=Pyrus ussuriensis x Pyrus communis TaxID=2448454 RepID=A0A5N5H3V1_9ROSA|nr:acyl carrier protein 1 [Pyrus ussuriensis x Pyrus communis]